MMKFCLIMVSVLLFSQSTEQVGCPSGDAPTVDDEGEPLHCGRGPNRVNCPDDRYCEIDSINRIAICCPRQPFCPNGADPVGDGNGDPLSCELAGNAQCPQNSYCFINPGYEKPLICCWD